MLDKVKSILTSHHYKVGYSSLYGKQTYKKYEAKEKNLSHNQYFTVYDRNNRVICRLHNLKEGEELDPKHHLPYILEFFEVLELPYREQVIAKLKECMR